MNRQTRTKDRCKGKKEQTARKNLCAENPLYPVRIRCACLEDTNAIGGFQFDLKQRRQVFAGVFTIVTKALVGVLFGRGNHASKGARHRWLGDRQLYANPVCANCRSLLVRAAATHKAWAGAVRSAAMGIATRPDAHAIAFANSGDKVRSHGSDSQNGANTGINCGVRGYTMQASFPRRGSNASVKNGEFG